MKRLINNLIRDFCGQAQHISSFHVEFVYMPCFDWYSIFVWYPSLSDLWRFWDFITVDKSLPALGFRLLFNILAQNNRQWVSSKSVQQWKTWNIENVQFGYPSLCCWCEGLIRSWNKERWISIKYFKEN